MIDKNFDKLKCLLSWLAILLFLCLVYFLTYTIAEPKAYDFMNKNVLIKKLPFDQNKQIYGHDDVVLIMIDKQSVEKYRWPWKRELYCDILDYLNEYAHAKVIVYDAIINTLDYDNPKSDEKFFKCITKIDNYVSGFMVGDNYWENEEFGRKYDQKFKAKFSENVEDMTTPTIDEKVRKLFNISPYEFKSLLIFPEPYFNVAKNVGSVGLFPGPISGNDYIYDEVVRSQNHFIKYKGAYYPSLSMKTFMLLNKISKILLTNNKVIFPEINQKIRYTHTGSFNVFPIKFYKLHEGTFYSHISYSAIDIINSYRQIKQGRKPKINPEVFKDKVVVIGAYVPAGEGLNDFRNSSIRPNHPGADIQATSIDNLIHNDFLNIIPQYLNIVLTILLMVLVYFSIKFLNLTKSVISIVLIIIGYIVSCCACFYCSVVINVLTPIVMFVLTTIFAYTNKYITENQNKVKVQNAMGKYMSQDVMQRVMENIDNLGLGGKKAIVTVLFADIRGFTSLSENLPAQQVSEILNEYFSEMEPIITGYNGIINKFIGDAVLAVFGEPIQDENHPTNAVKCGFAMLKKVEQLHKKWAREGKPEIEIGIGINTGEVFVGNIGSVNRMEYTVIGDTVNLASRLESYNKTYKTKMLISATTYKLVRQIADVIKIPDVQIRGKSHKVDIYDVVKVKIDEGLN